MAGHVFNQGSSNIAEPGEKRLGSRSVRGRGRVFEESA